MNQNPDIKEIVAHMSTLKTEIEKEIYIKNLNLSLEEIESLRTQIVEFMFELKLENSKPEELQKLREMKALFGNFQILFNGVKNTFLDN